MDDQKMIHRRIGNRRIVAPPPLPREQIPPTLEFNSRIHFSTGSSSSDATLDNTPQTSFSGSHRRAHSPSISTSSSLIGSGTGPQGDPETNDPTQTSVQWKESPRTSYRCAIPELIIDHDMDISSWKFQEKCLNAPIILLRGFLSHPNVLLPQNASFNIATIQQLHGDQEISVLNQKIDESGWNSENFKWAKMSLKKYLDYYKNFQQMLDVMRYFYKESLMAPSKLDDALEDIDREASNMAEVSHSSRCVPIVDLADVDTLPGNFDRNESASHNNSRPHIDGDVSPSCSKSHLVRLVLSLTRTRNYCEVEIPKHIVSSYESGVSSMISKTIVCMYLEPRDSISTETCAYWSDVDYFTFLKVNKARFGSSALKERYATLNSFQVDSNNLRESASDLATKDLTTTAPKAGSKLHSRLHTSFHDLEMLLAVAQPSANDHTTDTPAAGSGDNASDSINPLHDIHVVAQSTHWLDSNGNLSDVKNYGDSQALSMRLVLVDPRSREPIASAASDGIGYIHINVMSQSLFFYPVYVALPRAVDQGVSSSSYFSRGLATFAKTFVKSGLLQAEITLIVRTHWQFIFQFKPDDEKHFDSPILNAPTALTSVEASSHLNNSDPYQPKRQRVDDTPHVEEFPIPVNQSTLIIQLDEILKHGQIRFCSNLDIGSWTRHRKALKIHFPPWMMCGSQSDILRRLRQDVDGMTIPQVYIKVPGVWTGGHEENCRMSSVNCNHGPGSSEWFGIDSKHITTLRNAVLRIHKIDILHTEGRWFPKPDWLKQMKIPFMHGVQGPGDVIVLQGQTVHWVRSLGFSIHSSWNFGNFTDRQVESSLDRRTINSNLSRSGFPTQSLIPMSTLILDLSQELIQFVYKICTYLEEGASSLRGGTQCSPYIFTEEKILILKNLFPNHTAVSKALLLFSKRSEAKSVSSRSTDVQPRGVDDPENLILRDKGKDIVDSELNIEHNQSIILSYLKKDADFRQIFAFLDKNLMFRVIVELIVSIQELVSRLQDVVEVSGLLPELELSNSAVVHCDNKNCKQEIFEAYVLCPSCGYLCLTCASHYRCSSSCTNAQSMECVLSHTDEQPLDDPMVISSQDVNRATGGRDLMPHRPSSATHRQHGFNKTSQKREEKVEASLFPNNVESILLVPHKPGAKLLCKTAPWVLKRILIELVTIATAYFQDLTPLVNNVISRINVFVRKNAAIRRVDFANRATSGGSSCCYPAPASTINPSYSSANGTGTGTGNGKPPQSSNGNGISSSSAESSANNSSPPKQNILLAAYVKLQHQTKSGKPSSLQKDDLWSRRLKALNDFITDLKRQFYEHINFRQQSTMHPDHPILSTGTNTSGLPSHSEPRDLGSSYFKQFVDGCAVVYIPYEQKTTYFDGTRLVSFDLGSWLHRIQIAIWTLDETIDRLDAFYITLGKDLFSALFPCLNGYFPDEHVVSRNAHLAILRDIESATIGRDNSDVFSIDIDRALQRPPSSLVVDPIHIQTIIDPIEQSASINAPRKRKYSQGEIALKVDVNLPPLEKFNAPQMMINPFIDDSISPKNFTNSEINYILCENPDLNFISTGALTQTGGSDAFGGNFFDDKYKSLCGKETIPTSASLSSSSVSTSTSSTTSTTSTLSTSQHKCPNKDSNNLNPIGNRESIFATSDQVLVPVLHKPINNVSHMISEVIVKPGSDPSFGSYSSELSSDFSLDSEGNLYVRPPVPTSPRGHEVPQANDKEDAITSVAMHIRNARVSLEAAQNLIGHNVPHSEGIHDSQNDAATLQAALAILDHFNDKSSTVSRS